MPRPGAASRLSDGGRCGTLGHVPPARAVLLTGTVGVGKTTTLDHLGALWRGLGVPHALVDLDALRRTWPPPTRDPFQVGLALANLASLRANDTERASRQVGLAGVVEDVAERARLQAAVGVPMIVVRLSASRGEVRRRLLRRHRDPDEQESLRWYLRRAVELDAVLDRAGAHDLVVDVDDLSPRQVAQRVLDLVGERC